MHNAELITDHDLVTTTFAPMEMLDVGAGRSSSVHVATGDGVVPGVVGLCGAAGAGKSTAAEWLVERYGFKRIRLAGPLKDMLRALGLGERYVDGDLKETPHDLLGGKTPRQAMQWLGTEWGRFHFGDDFWINIWRAQVREALFGGRVVVDDVRFANEADAVRALGGIVVRIDCPWAGSSSGSGHASEAGQLHHDAVIRNDLRGDPHHMLGQLRGTLGLN